jgi:hypothetical protein
MLSFDSSVGKIADAEGLLFGKLELVAKICAEFREMRIFSSP